MSQRRGFTLIELLVVIAIIGLLASIIIVRLSSARTSAKTVRAKADIRQIRNAIAMLENDTNRWPSNQVIDTVVQGGGNEVWDLNLASAGIVGTNGSYSRWDGPYMSVVPLDPWGNPYFFDTDYDVRQGPQEKWAVVIGSFGPNGEGPNEYDSDDIYEVLIVEP